MSKFLDKAPDIRHLEIQLRLNKFSRKNELFYRGDNKNFFPVNRPPPPLGPPPPSSPSDLLYIPNVPSIDEIFNNNDFNFDFSKSYVPPAFNPQPLRGFVKKKISKQTTYGSNFVKRELNTTQTKSGDCLIGELERVIKKTPEGVKLILAHLF